MADVKALEAKVASLEKEKRQQNFQFTALEALLKKTKGEIDKLKEAAAPPANQSPKRDGQAEEKLREVTAALERSEGELKEARAKAEAAEGEVEEAKRVAEAAKGEAQDTNGGIAGAEQAAEAARGELKAAKEEIEKLGVKVTDLTLEAEQKEKALVEAEKQVAEMESFRDEAEGVQRALLEAQQKVVETEALLRGSDETAVELQCLKKTVGSMEEEKWRMMNELEEVRRAHGELQEQKRQVDTMLNESQGGSEAADAVQKELDRTRDAYEAIVQDLKDSVTKANSGADLLKQQLHQATSRAESESSRLKDGEAAFVETQKALEEAVGRISVLEASLGSEHSKATREHDLRLETDAKLSSLEPQICNLRAEVERLGDELDQRVRDSEGHAKETNDKMLQMEGIIAAHEARSSRISQEAEEAKARAAELQSACDDLECRLQAASASALTSTSSSEHEGELLTQATAAKEEALRFKSLAEEREAECDEIQAMMQAKETEVDELALRCHELLGENKKLQQRIAEADTRLLYAAELAISNPSSLNNSKSSAVSPSTKDKDEEQQEETQKALDQACEEAVSEATKTLEFRTTEADCSILGDDAASKKPCTEEVNSEPVKATRKTLRPLPAKQQQSSETCPPVSSKRLSGELAPPVAADEQDKENAANAATLAVPTKKARKLFNPVQLPEDLTGDPFASV